MKAVFSQLKKLLTGFDKPMIYLMATIYVVGLVTLYSASLSHPEFLGQQLRNILISLIILIIVANISPSDLMRLGLPLYVFGVVMLIAVLLFGVTKKGATRWIHVGIDIQPSEIMKIAVPLALAAFFHLKESQPKFLDYVYAIGILLVPFLLVAKQPDLGTAILIFSAGSYVIFFAGISWWFIAPIVSAVLILIVAVLTFGPDNCHSKKPWPGLHDYQKHRICTLLDPESDPRGKGFHIIQSKIAIGSGGLSGKGYMKGSQTQLGFIPEKHTDFIFAVYAEEFGFVGAVLLMMLYAAIILRGLMIAYQANFVFSRLIVSALSLSLLTYVFVNIGMTSGILPVVGVPLPFLSYGGTALMTLGIFVGIILSVSRQNRLLSFSR